MVPNQYRSRLLSRRHNGCGLLECQIERAVRCVETVRAVCVQLHQRCTCEVRMRCYLRRREVERQAQRIPLAVLVERAVAEDDVARLFVVIIDIVCVVRIVSQEEKGVCWVKRLAVGLGTDVVSSTPGGAVGILEGFLQVHRAVVAGGRDAS